MVSSDQPRRGRAPLAPRQITHSLTGRGGGAARRVSDRRRCCFGKDCAASSARERQQREKSNFAHRIIRPLLHAAELKHTHGAIAKIPSCLRLGWAITRFCSRQARTFGVAKAVFTTPRVDIEWLITGRLAGLLKTVRARQQTL